MRQSWETMTSVSAGHILLTPTQPLGSGRPQWESNPGPRHQESRALLTELPPPPPLLQGRHDFHGGHHSSFNGHLPVIAKRKAKNITNLEKKEKKEEREKKLREKRTCTEVVLIKVLL